MTLTYQFCGDCGCTLSKTGDAEAFKGIQIVQVGSLDDTGAVNAFEPAAELYVKERAEWLPELKGKAQAKEFS